LNPTNKPSKKPAKKPIIRQPKNGPAIHPSNQPTKSPSIRPIKKKENCYDDEDEPPQNSYA
jgi:hypothetical protein